MPNMLIGGVEKSLIDLLNVLETKFNGTNLNVEIKFIEMVGGMLKSIPPYVTTSQMNLPAEVQAQLIEIGTAKAILKNIRKGNFLKALILLYKKRIKKIPSPELRFNLDDIESDATDYDLAICYTTQNSFLIDYVAKKVTATQKIAWMHSSFISSGYAIQNSKDSLSYYDKIIGVSKQTVAEFNKLVPELKHKTSVVYNYINTEEIKKKSTLEKVDWDGDNNILTLGRLGKEKGQDLAIKSARILKKQGINFKWFFVGEGALRPQLEKMIKKYNLQDSCFLLGVKDNPYPYIKACQLFVQPSRFEGYCITLAEAKVLSKAIISANFAGANEQLAGDLGIVLDCAPKTLAAEIQLFLLDPSKKQKYIDNLTKTSISTNNVLEDFCSSIGENL